MAQVTEHRLANGPHLLQHYVPLGVGDYESVQVDANDGTARGICCVHPLKVRVITLTELRPVAVG